MASVSYIWHYCGRKRRYEKKEQAKKSAEKQSMKWYGCRYCRGYHLTSKKD